MSKTSDTVRIEFKLNDDIRDAGLVTPEDIIRYDDIVYGTDPKWQVLDVYRPKSAEGQKLPVIVSVHGGGFVYGDKERYQYYCMSLAQRGFAVVNFTYRLAPEHKFPANLEDTNSVFTWIVEKSEQYGFDIEHVFGVGDSAGANALALYTAICTNQEYALKYDFATPKGFVPTAIALNCGLYQMIVGEDGSDQLTQGLLFEYLPEGSLEEYLHLLDVCKHITQDFPATFIMTCQGDFLKEQAAPLVLKLAEKNVPFIYRMYGNVMNPLTHVFHCDMRSEDGQVCNDEECDFFKKFI